MFFFFLFQAILFYIPRWLWKNWEAGKIQALMMDLDLGIISEAEKRSKKKLLLDYLYSNLKNHNFWAYRYFFCELLALLNVIGKWDWKGFVTKNNFKTNQYYLRWQIRRKMFWKCLTWSLCCELWFLTCISVLFDKIGDFLE